MRKLIGLLCLLIATSSLALAQEQRKDTSDKKAPAADAKKQPSEKRMAQQERMEYCKVRARDMKGDEREAFMLRCLKESAPKNPPSRTR
jgi:hypothetical protein